MSTNQPVVYSQPPLRRPFATSAVALQAIIIDEEERILLLSSPHRNRENEWQIISGGLEAGETILEGTLRETREEAGEQIEVRPLGVVHVQTFHYDENIQFMIAVYYLLAYEGGPVSPGDDMRDSQYRWWHVDDLIAADIQYHPSVHPWMLRRAVELYRLWKNHSDDAFLLQPPL